MKRLIILTIISLLVVCGCKKDEPDDIIPVPPEESVLDYMPLAIGNFWIYENFRCDSGEVDCVSTSIDTSRITKDTLINGNTYFKWEQNYPLTGMTLFLRDSGDYLITSYGYILFTLKDSSQIFNERFIISGLGDTLYHFFDRLNPNSIEVPVESGVYQCMDFQQSFFRVQDNFQIEHTGHRYYAKNVGLVKEAHSWMASLVVEKRELIGYYIVDNE